MKHKNPNMAPTARETTVNVDLKDTPNVKCDNCGDLRFEQVYVMKRLSALVSPTGKEGIVPIPVFGCLNCGHINVEFLPPELFSREKKNGETVQKTTLDLIKE